MGKGVDGLCAHASGPLSIIIGLLSTHLYDFARRSTFGSLSWQFDNEMEQCELFRESSPGQPPLCICTHPF